MMTEGRLRAIGIGLARNRGPFHKYATELVAETRRLRAALQTIANGTPTARPAQGTGQPDLDQAYNLQNIAQKTLAEPDLGPPDIICSGPPVSACRRRGLPGG